MPCGQGIPGPQLHSSKTKAMSIFRVWLWGPQDMSLALPHTGSHRTQQERLTVGHIIATQCDLGKMEM